MLYNIPQCIRDNIVSFNKENWELVQTQDLSSNDSFVTIGCCCQKMNKRHTSVSQQKNSISHEIVISLLKKVFAIKY